MYLKKLICFLSLGIVTYSQSQSVGGVTTGAALYCDSVNSGFISLTGYTGQILFWESSVNNGSSWDKIINSTSTQSYNRLQKTTSFRAVVQDGLSPQDVSSISTISVHVPGNGGTLTGGGLFCASSGDGNLLLNNAPGPVLSFQQFNGNSWIALAHTSTLFAYPSITKSTKFRAIVSSIQGCPNDTSTIASFTIDAQTMAGSILNGDSVCYGAAGGTLELSGSVGDILGWYNSFDNGLNWNSLSTTNTSVTYSAVTQNISYKAVVKNGSCPSQTTVPSVVAYFKKNKADAGEDRTITRHEELHLDGKGNGKAEWDNSSTLSNSNIFQPKAEPKNTTQYVLTLTDIHGCISSDSVLINVIVPVPSAITPNGDGFNDFFQIDNITAYGQNSLTVFNRWGTVVFNAAPYNNEWNGKSNSGHDLPDDLYYYLFDYGQGEKPTTNYILIKR